MAPYVACAGLYIEFRYKSYGYKSLFGLAPFVLLKTRLGGCPSRFRLDGGSGELKINEVLHDETIDCCSSGHRFPGCRRTFLIRHPNSKRQI